MFDLTVINHNGQFTIDSREVAEMTDKRHDHLLRDIDGYVEVMQNPILGNGLTVRYIDFFIPNEYESGNPPRKYRNYLLTRKGCDMVANKMTGEKGVLFTAAYVTKFEEMEKSLTLGSYAISDPIERAKRWIQEQEEKKQLESHIKEITPAAEFGMTVGSSKGAILVRDYVKLLANDGIKIGQDQFFSWLHVNGYIYKTKEYKPQWRPYVQYVSEQELFKVREIPISTNENGDQMKFTLRITGKRQKYFYDKLKEERKSA